MKLQLKKSLVALALAGMATAAWAIVTFDPNTGSGFVGKGDVCTALGISNCKNPPAVYFTYSSSTQYTQECEKDNGRQTISNTFQRRRTVNSAVTANVRNQGGNASGSSSQNEGYILTGFGGDLTPPLLGTDGLPIIPPTGNLCPVFWTAVSGITAVSLGSALSVSLTGDGGTVIWSQ